MGWAGCGWYFFGKRFYIEGKGCVCSSTIHTREWNDTHARPTSRSHCKCPAKPFWSDWAAPSRQRTNCAARERTPTAPAVVETVAAAAPAVRWWCIGNVPASAVTYDGGGGWLDCGGGNCCWWTLVMREWRVAYVWRVWVCLWCVFDCTRWSGALVGGGGWLMVVVLVEWWLCVSV